MDLPGYESESKRAFEAHLRATLDVVPAYTWYARPSGALTFVNKRHADISVTEKTIPVRLHRVFLQLSYHALVNIPDAIRLVNQDNFPAHFLQ